jgi:hypothetical protein
MNLADYSPSVPVEDRRPQQGWRPRQLPPQGPPLMLQDRGEPRSLLDLWYGGNDVRSGLSRDVGYNMIGQDPRMGWRNRLPLPNVQMQNYPANVALPYEPANIGWDRPWTTGR